MSERQLIIDRKPVAGLNTDTVTVREALKHVGLNPDKCHVYQLANEGEEGQSIGLDTVLDLSKGGDKPGKPVRLRCVPNDRNAG